MDGRAGHTSLQQDPVGGLALVPRCSCESMKLVVNLTAPLGPRMHRLLAGMGHGAVVWPCRLREDGPGHRRRRGVELEVLGIVTPLNRVVQGLDVLN